MMRATGSGGGPSDGDIERLAADINSAFHLRESFFQRSWDRRLEAHDWTILYAVDTDVLHHYFHTEEIAESGKDSTEEIAESGKGRPFQIFQGPEQEKEPDDEESRVGDVITYHLIRVLPQKNREKKPLPLLMLPGHAGEARKIYEKFVSYFIDQGSQHKAVKEALIKILDDLDRFDVEERMKAAQAKEEELHRLLYTLEVPHSKYREYNKLLLERRLASLRNAAEHRDLIEAAPKVAAVFRNLKRIAEDSAVGEASRWWETELNKIDFPDFYAKKDKKALSTLEAINNQLRPHNAKVILVTMNEAIIDLGHKYPFNKAGPENSRKLTFSDFYIRHLRCFLSEPGIFRPQADGKEVDVTIWLDTFLAEVTEAAAFDLPSFRAMKTAYESQNRRELARETLKRDPELHKDFFEHWQGHLKNINFAHVSTAPNARQVIISKIGQANSKRADVLAALKEHTTKLTEASWYHFFQTAANLGYGLIGISPDAARQTARNPPAIYLNDREMGDQVLEFIANEGVIKKEAEILGLLKKLEDSSDAKDKYASILLYAVLFTLANRWSVAHLIAKRAIALAEREGKVKSHGSLSGREANYFAAVANRMTAKNIQELDASDEYIRAAREALEREEAAAKENATSDGVAVPTALRFDAETASIAGSRLLFRASAFDWNIAGKRTLINDIREVMRGIEKTIVSADAEKIDAMRVASLVNLRGNYFTCFFMLDCAGVLNDADLERLRGHVLEQARTLKLAYHDEQNVSKPSIPDMFLLTYAASFGRYDDAEIRRVQQLYREFDDAAVERKNYCVMPYDRQRYDKLDQLIELRS